jgi:hypothetical protein
MELHAGSAQNSFANMAAKGSRGGGNNSNNNAYGRGGGGRGGLGMATRRVTMVDNVEAPEGDLLALCQERTHGGQVLQEV